MVHHAWISNLDIHSVHGVVMMMEDKEQLRDALSAWAQHYAHILGVKEPTIKFIKEHGACLKAARAHIHTETTYWNLRGVALGRGKYGKVAHKRGTICINPEWLDFAMKSGIDSIESLMAHEVSHLRRGKKPSRGHCKKMFNIVHQIRGSNRDYDVVFAPNAFQWNITTDVSSSIPAGACSSAPACR